MKCSKQILESSFAWKLMALFHHCVVTGTRAVCILVSSAGLENHCKRSLNLILPRRSNGEHYEPSMAIAGQSLRGKANQNAALCCCINTKFIGKITKEATTIVFSIRRVARLNVPNGSLNAGTTKTIKRNKK